MGEARRRARDYTHSVPGRDDRLRSMSRVSDFMPTVPAKPQASSETAEDLLHGSEDKHKIRKQRRRVWRQVRIPRPRNLVIIAACLLVLVGSGWLLKWQHDKNAPPSNPFTAAQMASVKFPLYYPTQLPDGYRLDPSSVTEPQADVVVVTIRGPHGEKLYMSEVPRPKTFDLGGFYQSLSGLKEIGVSDGAIAIGYDSKARNEIASRADNQTWVLCNTTAHIPQAQLITMLKTLAHSY